MEKIDISFVKEEERNTVAEMLSNSEPWITLGVTLEQCLKTCHDPEYMIFVAHVDSLLAGTIVAHHRGLASSPYIKSVLIAEEYRGKGVGVKLMEYVENYFRKESCHIFLCVSSFNTDAQAFYKRIGYTQCGEFKEYIIEGASEFLMYKRLK
jgi:[ribosomal protein S18]-alanine N-acetyltransferase